MRITKDTWQLIGTWTIVATGFLVGMVGCQKPADIASDNLSTAADNFQIQRRVVFYNGITNQYILVIEGLCSLGNQDTTKRMSVTCKVGTKEYKKHFLGLSDNVTFFAEQVQPVAVGTYHYRVFFTPQSIIPDVDFRGSANELPGVKK